MPSVAPASAWIWEPNWADESLEMVQSVQFCGFRLMVVLTRRAFLGVAPTHCKVHFETVDIMRAQNGRITDHWVGNLLSLTQQIGGWICSCRQINSSLVKTKRRAF